MGCTADVFQIVAAEEVRAFGCVHDAAEFADIHGDVVGDERLAQLLECLNDVLFVASFLVLACGSGMSPFGLAVLVLGRERKGVRVVLVDADHHAVSGVGREFEALLERELCV